MGKGADGGVGFDSGYISSIHGILQIVEIILSFIVIICVAIAHWTLHLGGGWTLFVAIVAVVIVSLLFVLNVFHLRERLGAQFSMIELIICGVFALFYFIAFIIEAVIYSKYRYYTADVVAAVFCAMAFIVFVIHLILHLKRWRFSFSSSSTTATTTTTTTTTSAKA